MTLQADSVMEYAQHRDPGHRTPATAGCSSPVRPLAGFTMAQAMKPNAMPSAMEKFSGIVIATRNTGAYTVTSSQGRSRRQTANMVATNTSAGAEAKATMGCSRGAGPRQARNSAATVTAVRPVRPPAWIPAQLSIRNVVVLVPNSAPTVGADGLATRRVDAGPPMGERHGRCGTDRGRTDATVSR
jgi:hypothetical protein